MSFSTDVKDEIFKTFQDHQGDDYILLGFALMTNARFNGRAVTFSTAHGDLARTLQRCAQEELGIDSSLVEGEELYMLKIEGNRDRSIVTRFLDDEFSYDPKTGEVSDEWVERDDENTSDSGFPLCVRTLQAAFLAGGSLSDPGRAYHLEMVIRRLPAARQLVQLLAAYDLPAAVIKRYGYNVVYMKGGDRLADFLALTGAHVAHLDFENLRLEKDLRNNVNRIVNCDTANVKRMVDASARQLRLLDLIHDSGSWSSLPEELRATAELRMNNPDLSLRELGELMDPPVGKSGVSHRLRRLEKMAREIEEEGS